MQNRATYDRLLGLVAGLTIIQPILPPPPVNRLERARQAARQVPGGRAVLAGQAALAAQKHPCGIGLQRRLLPGGASYESAVAVRIGDHLSSELTFFLSTNSF